MDTVRACLCDQVGHHGICQGCREPRFRLSDRCLMLYPVGAVCRECFEAVTRRPSVSLRNSCARASAGRAPEEIRQRKVAYPV